MLFLWLNTPAARAQGVPLSPGESAAQPGAPASAPADAASAAQSRSAFAPFVWAPQADEAVESTRQTMHRTVEWLARGVDSWFGDKPFESGGRVSDGEFGVSLLKRQDQGREQSVRFNARLRLPNLEQRTYLFIGSDDLHQTVTDQPDALSRQEQPGLSDTATNRSFFAGLGLPVLENVDFRLGLHGLLKPYTQLRYRHSWQLDDADSVDFRQTVFWTVDDHLGTTAVASLDHLLSSSWVLRWLNSTTLSQRTQRWEWSSVVGSYRAMGAQRLLSLEGLVSGTRSPDGQASDLGLQVKWAQPLSAHGLLGELVFGHFWTQLDPSSGRRAQWALGASVALRF